MSNATRACGQLLSVGFDGLVAPPDLLERIATSQVGGVMLFRPNVRDPEQVAELVRQLRAAAPTDAPLVVSVDQEGGLVQRLRAPWTEWPPMLVVGQAGDQTGDASRTERVGQAIGRELAALGIGWNFAPVLDVHTNPANPVIGNRSFGATPDAAASQALAFWRGLNAAGVAGCGKHFPGHGDTHIDSHHGLPVVGHGTERLRAVELAPFEQAARAGMEAIMTAHVIFPALDPSEPATLSPRVIAEVLRGELGYQGLVVSDDLGMRAVADRHPPDELAVRAVRAGCDHLLVREPLARQLAAYEGLVRAAERDAGFASLVDAAATRVKAFKARLTVPMPLAGAELRASVGPEEHRALAASFRGDAGGATPSSSPVALG